MVFNAQSTMTVISGRYRPVNKPNITIALHRNLAWKNEQACPNLIINQFQINQPKRARINETYSEGTPTGQKQQQAVRDHTRSTEVSFVHRTSERKEEAEENSS